MIEEKNIDNDNNFFLKEKVQLYKYFLLIKTNIFRLGI